MADVHNKETRSYNISRIKGKDTKPEILVRKFLHAYGFCYRLHVKISRETGSILTALFFLHSFLLSIEPNFPLIRSGEVMPIPLQGQMLLRAMSLNILKGR